MPDLVSGTEIKAADFPVAASEVDATNQADVTSTTYITGTPVVDTTFTAPTSGRVLLIVGGGASDDAATNRARIAPQVFEGTDATGTEIVAPAASLRGIMSMNTATASGFWSRATLLEGLTPEQTYYARVVYRVDGGSAVDILARDLQVVPVP